MLTYYMFNQPVFNGFLEKLSLERNKTAEYKIIYKKQIMAYSLSEVLNNYLPKKKIIDFISIDVEGLDYDVLISNNWKKYMPNL